jgi:hypothetical protein
MKFATLPLVVSLALVSLAAGQSSFVRVVSTAGAWSSDGKLVVRGSQVALERELATQAGGDVLLDCRDAGQLVYSCRGACKIRPCGPVAPGVAVHPVKIERGLWAWLFEREPTEPVVAAVRTGGNPSDAVLRADAKGVHFGAALSRVVEGRYCLSVQRLPADSRGPVATVAIDWDRRVDPTGTVAAPALAPGLYTLERGEPAADGTCRVDPDTTIAWVLVASDASFERLNAEWTRQVAALTELGQTDVSSSVIAAVRHAILAGLAESAKGR